MTHATGKPPDAAPFEEIAASANPSPVCGAGVTGKVVVVTVDGVRWQEIFQGSEAKRTHQPVVDARHLTPHLHALGDRGAFVGAPSMGVISATGPNYVSLPGYSEIFVGRPAPCQVNTCSRVTMPTFFDQAFVAGAKVAAFTSWENIDRAVTYHLDGSFFRSCGHAGVTSRKDPETIESALEYYERERPDVFYIALADTDVLAHKNDYDGYLGALRQADDTIGRLEALAGPDATFFVTADHGRSNDFDHHGKAPESGRVWLVAAGPTITARGEVLSPRPRHLADIAPTARQILGLAKDEAPNAGEPLTELFESSSDVCSSVATR